MVNYLERSISIIKQIKEDVKLHNGTIIGKSDSGGIVNHIGTVKHNNKEIYLGLKTKIRNGVNNYSGGVPFELASILQVYNDFPSLQGELPSFVGILQHSKGEIIGILMEDFSQGGKYKVQSANPHIDLNKLPEIIKQTYLPYNKMPDKDGENENLAGVVFFSNGKRRIADTFNLWHSRSIGDPIQNNLTETYLELRSKYAKQLTIVVDEWESGGYKYGKSS